jgi:hypothetical protein
MSLRRVLYRLVRKREVGVAFGKREEARTPKRPAAKVDLLVWEASQTLRGMSLGAVDNR